MAELKREPTKYLRDACKALYKKGTECEICGTHDELEFHHYKTLSILVNNFLRGTTITTMEEMDEFRNKFKEIYWDEIYEQTVTICKTHHLKLHSIYGKNPALGTASKQERWVAKQKAKYGLVQ